MPCGSRELPQVNEDPQVCETSSDLGPERGGVGIVQHEGYVETAVLQLLLDDWAHWSEPARNVDVHAQGLTVLLPIAVAAHGVTGSGHILLDLCLTLAFPVVSGDDFSLRVFVCLQTAVSGVGDRSGHGRAFVGEGNEFFAVNRCLDCASSVEIRHGTILCIYAKRIHAGVGSTVRRAVGVPRNDVLVSVVSRDKYTRLHDRTGVELVVDHPCDHCVS